MKISAINYQNCDKTNFKAVYPVRYWGREVSSGKVVQILDLKTIGSFQEKIVEYINKMSPTGQNIKAVKENKIKKTKVRPYDEMLQKLFNLLIKEDIEFRQNMTIRSFTNYVIPGRNLSYFISGSHVNEFNNKYAKPVGRAIREAKKQETPKLIEARNNFRYGGYEYVNDYTRRLKNTEGRTQVLNILYDIELGQNRQITGYKMADFNIKDEFIKQ